MTTPYTGLVTTKCENCKGQKIDLTDKAALGEELLTGYVNKINF